MYRLFMVWISLSGFAGRSQAQCATGEFLEEGAGACRKCSVGLFSDDTSGTATTCTVCPAGFHQSCTGQDSCKVCGVGTVSNAGQASCSATQNRDKEYVRMFDTFALQQEEDGDGYKFQQVCITWDTTWHDRSVPPAAYYIIAWSSAEKKIAKSPDGSLEWVPNQDATNREEDFIMQQMTMPEVSAKGEQVALLQHGSTADTATGVTRVIHAPQDATYAIVNANVDGTFCIPRRRDFTLVADSFPTIGSALFESLYITLEAVIIDGSLVQTGLPTMEKPWFVVSECDDNNYLDTSVGSPHEWRCRKCPNGASCRGPVTWAQVKAKFGYFRLSAYDSGVGEKGMRVFEECLNPAACLGGQNPAMQQRYPRLAKEDAAEERCNSDLGFRQLCISAGNGPREPCRLCRACRQGYFPQGISDCMQCPGPILQAAVVLAAAFFLGACLYIFLSAALSGDASAHAHLAQPLQKIFLNHMQLVSLAGNFPLKWPPLIMALLGAFGMIARAGSYIFNPQCQQKGEPSASMLFLKQLLILLLPILSLFISCGFWLSLHWLRKLRRLRCMVRISRWMHFSSFCRCMHGSLFGGGNSGGICCCCSTLFRYLCFCCRASTEEKDRALTTPELFHVFNKFARHEDLADPVLTEDGLCDVLYQLSLDGRHHHLHEAITRRSQCKRIFESMANDAKTVHFDVFLLWYTSAYVRKVESDLAHVDNKYFDLVVHVINKDVHKTVVTPLHPVKKSKSQTRTLSVATATHSIVTVAPWCEFLISPEFQSLKLHYIIPKSVKELRQVDVYFKGAQLMPGEFVAINSAEAVYFGSGPTGYEIMVSLEKHGQFIAMEHSLEVLIARESARMPTREDFEKIYSAEMYKKQLSGGNTVKFRNVFSSILRHYPEVYGYGWSKPRVDATYRNFKELFHRNAERSLLDTRNLKDAQGEALEVNTAWENVRREAAIQTLMELAFKIRRQQRHYKQSVEVARRQHRSLKAARRGRKSITSGDARSSREIKIVDKIIATFVTLFYLLFPTLCSSVFTLMACQAVGKKHTYLQQDLQVECFSPEHMTWFLGLCLPCFLLYVIGTPVGIFLVLYAERHRLEHKNIRFRYSILMLGYREEYFYWESVVAARKAIVSAIAVFLLQVPTETQALTAEAFVVVLLVAHLHAHPYIEVTVGHDNLQKAETFALATTFATLVSGLLMYENIGGTSEYTLQLVCTCVIVGCNALFICLFSWWWLMLKRMDLSNLLEKADGHHSCSDGFLRCLTRCGCPDWFTQGNKKEIERQKRESIKTLQIADVSLASRASKVAKNWVQKFRARRKYKAELLKSIPHSGANSLTSESSLDVIEERFRKINNLSTLEMKIRREAIYFGRTGQSAHANTSREVATKIENEHNNDLTRKLWISNNEATATKAHSRLEARLRRQRMSHKKNLNLPDPAMSNLDAPVFRKEKIKMKIPEGIDNSHIGFKVRLTKDRNMLEVYDVGHDSIAWYVGVRNGATLLRVNGSEIHSKDDLIIHLKKRPLHLQFCMRNVDDQEDDHLDTSELI